jgi:hypothetical protein
MTGYKIQEWFSILRWSRRVSDPDGDRKYPVVRDISTRQGRSNGIGIRNRNLRQQDLINEAYFVCHNKNCSALCHYESSTRTQPNNSMAKVSEEDNSDIWDQEN